MTRALQICTALILCCGIVGCQTGGGKDYEDCTLSGISTLEYQLTSTQFKIATTPDGITKGTILVLSAGGPAYSAFTRPTTAASPAQGVGASSQVAYPFLNLLDGTTYVTGDAPAAQTEHVVAGSQSTEFIVEVDHNGEPTNDTKWIDRIYVLKVKDHMCVWAQQVWNGPRPTKGTVVKAGEYVEATFNGRQWTLSDPQKYSDPARQKAVDDTLVAAQAVGFP